MQPGVLVEQHGPITVLTLDNPKRRNAFSEEIKQQLASRLAEAMASEACRAIVLTGAAGTFCAGGDVTSFGTRTPMQGRAVVRDQRAFLHPMLRGEKPIVAAVEGYAYGAGFGLAMAADHVVAARDAKFCAAFNKIGLMPDGGLLWTLPQRIGTAKAREMFMLASVVTGEEGRRLRLVDTLCEPGEALAAAMRKAERYAQASPLSIAMTKAAFAKWPLKLDDLLTLEAEGQAILFNTDDCKNAVRAFMEKRKPAFYGR